MDKKIGRIVFLFLSSGYFVNAVAHDLSVSLRVTDHQGYAFKEAGIGVPFIVQVEVINEGRKDTPRPQLALPAKIGMAQLGTTSSVRTVNNDTITKKTYQYSAVCNEEGTFTIGPATVALADGQEVRSNGVTVKVSAQQKGADKGTDKPHAFVEFSADTVNPYVGQPVGISLKFYYADESVHLDQLQEPTFKECKAAPLQGPTNGQATVRGARYGYFEWKTTVFPTRAGKLVIPAVAAHISLPAKQQRGHMVDMFAMVNHMFGAGRQEEIYSNALTLQVQTLPDHAGQDVQAVGKFTSLNAKLGLEKAQTGEGINFILELVGEGNFSMIGHPVLNMPEGLKYYDSHTKEHQLSEKMRKKDFEYVLQAVTPGTYEIPAQELEYFDSKTKAYKTIASRPLKLVITGDQKKSLAPYVGQEQTDKKVDVSEDIVLERTLKGGGAGQSRHIPWNWFMALTGAGVLVMLLWFIRNVWECYKQKNASYFESKGAFTQARQHIKQAKKAKKAADIYHIFMNVFSARLKLPKSEISEAFIEKQLKVAGFSDEQIIQWRHFFSHTLAVTFAVIPETEDMYVQAEQWLLLLERIL